MPKKLTNYRQKRDPAATNEPFSPEPSRSIAQGEKGAFVVHLHAATRLHYDLRLEVGGALRSFAVPRGPSLNPQDKRLAVQTEDHPLEYLDFEAVIPEGNYGAGAMIVWDRGAVTYLEQGAEAGIAAGKIDFLLSGHKLQGRFALVRTSGRKGELEKGPTQWLLIKKQDAYSREDDITETAPWSVLSGLRVDELKDGAARLAAVEAAARNAGAKPGDVDARRLTPMLCDTGSGPLDSPEHLYELKLDGVRIVADKRGGDVILRYRSGRNCTASYPEVVRALRALPVERLVLDGEVVAYDEAGRPDFQRLGPRIAATREHQARKALSSTAVHYLVFDLLALGSLDVRPLPLRERKALLASLLRGKGIVRLLDHIDQHGSALLDFCRKQGLEGVVGKRAESPYVVGPGRSGHWTKHKCERDADFVVVGYTTGEGSRSDFGALELGSFAPDGTLVSRGRVGSGFDADSIRDLLRRLEPLQQDHCDATGSLSKAKGTHNFVAPEIVVSVRFIGWTEEGRVRHAVYRGMRPDLPKEACTAAPGEEREQKALDAVDTQERDQALSIIGDAGRVRLTNQGKVFWPDERYTKGDLCGYYDAIADTILPYLRGRPVLMVRYPDGIDGKSFFQWNVPAGTPSWVQTFPLRTMEEDGKDRTAFLVNDRETLLFLANLGAIPLHVLASSAEDLERSDFMTLDFDLGGAPLSHAITLARTLLDLLTDLGLPSYPKTSGQTGLHVLIPTAGARFNTTKVFAELLGRILHRRHPDLSTMQRLKHRRTRGVYIDTGQTGRSRAIVAPYSLRAHAGATVSTPLSWDEVSYNLDPRRYHMFSVPERLQRAHDPMAPMLSDHPDIAAAVAGLAKFIG